MLVLMCYVVYMLVLCLWVGIEISGSVWQFRTGVAGRDLGGLFFFRLQNPPNFGETKKFYWKRVLAGMANYLNLI